MENEIWIPKEKGREQQVGPKNKGEGEDEAGRRDKWQRAFARLEELELRLAWTCNAATSSPMLFQVGSREAFIFCCLPMEECPY